MAEALDLVEEELQSVEANIPEESRSSWKRPTYSVICYKYEIKGNETEGKLTYSTWNDEIQGYIEVTEEEITAFVTPGTWIFQCRGGGMKSLNGIEFDAYSRSVIGDGNYELIPNKLWLTVIPENTGDVQLKYDILYDASKDDQGVIRLDPKIEVVPEEQ